MSFKSKNLEYSQEEPAFLRRIRGEIRGAVDDPDRQINPIARSKASKRLERDEDDGPTYVMEETNESMSKEDYEAMLKEENAPDSTIFEKTAGQADVSGMKANYGVGEGDARPKLKVAETGGLLKKRKAVKIVGDDEEDDTTPPTNDKGGYKSAKPETKKGPKKKKVKAVKLSFGDDEEA